MAIILLLGWGDRPIRQERPIGRRRSDQSPARSYQNEMAADAFDA
ncbi:hypothetical protein RN629_16665 [Sphingomonadaceae bacterium jetA1]|jgi:hypothetical protein